MSLKLQVPKLSYCQKNTNNRRQSLCSEYRNDHTTASELKSEFVKINPNQKYKTRRGCGHSQMRTNHFSRRNSAATIDSTGSSTNILNSVLAADTSTPATALTNSIRTNQFYNRRMHSQQSWSMSHSKNDDQVSNVGKNKKIKNYEFTEQRCNYERMTQQQQQLLQQQQQRPWSSEQVIRYNVSNPRIPTCSVDPKQHDLKTAKFCDAINAKFIALSEFRMQNSKDCFSDSHHRLQLLRAQTPPNNITMTSDKSLTTTDTSETQPYELNWCYNNMDDVDSSKMFKDNKNISNSLASSFSSLSLTSLTPMPYAARQRILREQLAKEFPHRKSVMLGGVNKSAALSYQL